MEIYLIRHTTPKVEKGVCYGQTDLDVTESFIAEANLIQQILPTTIETVYSSPLQRCSKLANHLFSDKKIELHKDLMEINCGIWEMQYWDKIPRLNLQPWMDDFVNVSTPNGESYLQLHERVTKIFSVITKLNTTAAIVAHGGVIRSILSYITNTPLKESFDVFSLHYGCVIKIIQQQNTLVHQVLHNILPSEKEQHRPSYY